MKEEEEEAAEYGMRWWMKMEKTKKYGKFMTFPIISRNHQFNQFVGLLGTTWWKGGLEFHGSFARKRLMVLRRVPFLCKVIYCRVKLEALFQSGSQLNQINYYHFSKILSQLDIDLKCLSCDSELNDCSVELRKPSREVINPDCQKFITILQWFNLFIFNTILFCSLLSPNYNIPLNQKHGRTDPQALMV